MCALTSMSGPEGVVRGPLLLTGPRCQPSSVHGVRQERCARRDATGNCAGIGQQVARDRWPDRPQRFHPDFSEIFQLGKFLAIFIVREKCFLWKENKTLLLTMTAQRFYFETLVAGAGEALVTQTWASATSPWHPFSRHVLLICWLINANNGRARFTAVFHVEHDVPPEQLRPAPHGQCPSTLGGVESARASERGRRADDVTPARIAQRRWSRGQVSQTAHILSHVINHHKALAACCRTMTAVKASCWLSVPKGPRLDDRSDSSAASRPAEDRALGFPASRLVAALRSEVYSQKARHPPDMPGKQFVAWPATLWCFIEDQATK